MLSLVLASRSPRRAALLSEGGFEFEIVSPRVPEKFDVPLTLRELTLWNAIRKGMSIAQTRPGAVVLGADTLVALGDQIIGKQGRKYVPFFATFFFFILFSNLMGLLPGFVAPTSNLNTTVGLALCSFVGYNIIGVREQGASYFKHFVGPMTSLPGSSLVAKLAFVPVLIISVCFFLILELFSHGLRPVSLSLRLFGNMMGDHEVIGAFIGLTKLVIPVAFYAMGTLVSVIQAFVFTLLSMIYVALAVSHGHDEEHGHEAHESSH